ncbi:MAG: mitochondrial fission ELM1 family protein [Deltaproteobacteria bacterium]|nr:mitochondrial fission ELM1 family protein [Deltaproteobacteria bacterium]
MSKGLDLIIISDGKPGHLSGSKGVLNSIELLTNVNFQIIKANLRSKFWRWPLRMLLNYGGWLKWLPAKAQILLIKLFYKIEDINSLLAVKKGSWVISSGGDTSFLNAWITRLCGLKNIYCSSLRGLKPSLFTLLILTQGLPDSENQIIVPVAPAPVNRKEINKAGELFRSELHLEGKKVLAVLLGGSGAGFVYDTAIMKAIAEGILGLAEKQNARLLITTSRRTGIEAEKSLKGLIEKHPHVSYATFFNHVPEKVVSKFLGSSDAVFCTAESGSMITESLAAGKPTYAIYPQEVSPQPFYAQFLQQHIEAKHIKPVAIAELETIDLASDNKSYFNILENDPVSELAKKIKPWIFS